jgi:hypothetical protein
MMHQPLWLRDLAAYSLQVAIIVIAGGLLPPLLRVRAPKLRLIYWQGLLGSSPGGRTCYRSTRMEQWVRLASAWAWRPLFLQNGHYLWLKWFSP